MDSIDKLLHQTCMINDISLYRPSNSASCDMERFIETDTYENPHPILSLFDLVLCLSCICDFSQRLDLFILGGVISYLGLVERYRQLSS